uniref:Uncharacterized protein n=1 Tax=Arundo donax TaxID=35708 RepID=A0A0A9AWK3_ARUDO
MAEASSDNTCLLGVASTRVYVRALDWVLSRCTCARLRRRA